MSAEVSGLDIQVVGVILMVVGVLGFVLSLLFWSSWGGPAYVADRRRRTYVEEGPAPPGPPPP